VTRARAPRRQVTELMGLDSVTRNMRTAMKRLPDFERLLLHIHVNGRKDDSHPRSRAIIMSYCPNERRTRALQQVRKTPRWPRSWTNFSLS
jgi:hypothetical protein